MRSYRINYNLTDENDVVRNWTSFAKINSFEDATEKLEQEYKQIYDFDSNFKIVSIVSEPAGDIDYELSKRMNAVRSMCEVGHKVRAESKIRNRQPLKAAYIFFSNQNVQDFMLYADNNSSYAKIFADELNVDKVEFVESVEKFFNYNLKPNFKTLGPKGFGKQAQGLKTFLNSMSIEDRNNLYNELKTENVVVQDIPLTIADIEVEYSAKPGFTASTNKSGAMVLDTRLDENLIERGFVSDLRSALQNVRKICELNLSDRIELEIFSNSKSSVIEKFKSKLCKDLLATKITTGDIPEDKSQLHTFDIDDEVFYVKVLK